MSSSSMISENLQLMKKEVQIGKVTKKKITDFISSRPVFLHKTFAHMIQTLEKLKELYIRKCNTVLRNPIVD